MAYLKIPRIKNTTREVVYDDFSGGINYLGSPSLIKPNQSPEAQNVRIRDFSISKRSGYAPLHEISLGTGKINGLFQYKKADGEEFTLVAHGGNLFKLN